MTEAWGCELAGQSARAAGPGARGARAKNLVSADEWARVWGRAMLYAIVHVLVPVGLRLCMYRSVREQLIDSTIVP